jgi:hypothetical protein
LSGLPPHFADQQRSTTAKAVGELDQLKAEIDTLIAESQGEETYSPSPAAELAS